MIRTVQYRALSANQWQEAILHGFSEGNAILEKADTGELFLQAIEPLGHVSNIKFSVTSQDWVKLQQEAKRTQQTMRPLV